MTAQEITVTSTGAVHGRYTLGPDSIWRDYDGAEIATCTQAPGCTACPRPADTFGQGTAERAYMRQHGIVPPPFSRNPDSIARAAVAAAEFAQENGSTDDQVSRAAVAAAEAMTG